MSSPPLPPQAPSQTPPHLYVIHRLGAVLNYGLLETSCGLTGNPLVVTQTEERITCTVCRPELRTAGRTGPPVSPSPVRPLRST